MAVETAGDGGGDCRFMEAAGVVGMGVGEPGGGDGDTGVEPQIDGGEMNAFGFELDAHGPNLC